MLVVLLVCVIILFFSFKLCDLGFFKKSEEGVGGISDRIQYVTTTKPFGTINSEIFENISTALSQRINASTKVATFGTTPTTQVPKTTASKKYVKSMESYLKYVKSFFKSTEKTKETIKEFNKTTEAITPDDVTKSTELNTTQHTSDIMNTFSTQEMYDTSNLSDTTRNNPTTTLPTNEEEEELRTSSSKDVIMERLVEKSSARNTETTSKSGIGKIEIGSSTTVEGITQDLRTQTIKETTQTQTESLPKLKKRLSIDQDICNSTDCDLAAARIISSMDYTQQPCENFYEFACGGISGSKKEKVDIFSPQLLDAEDNPEFMNSFNTFYHSCLKHEDRFHYQKRIKRAKKLLHSIGSFHFDGQTNTTYNITEFVANLILFKAMPLFEVDIDIDPDDSTYILKVMMPDQTSLDIEHWSSLSESKRKCLRETNEKAVGSPLNMTVLYKYFRYCQMNYSDFLDSIDTAVIELGFFSHLSEKEIFKHIRDIRVFIEFEIFSLFEEIVPPPQLQEMVVRRQYEKVKLKELEKEFPLIEWEKLFRMISNENITSETIIQMYNKQYFEDVFRGLSLLNRGMLNNAFLAILANSLFENTVLPSHKHTRTDYCKERSEELMPDIINYLYKKIIPSDELNEHNAYTEELYRDLAKRFSKSLDNLDWLDDSSKASIRNKLYKLQLVMFRNDDVQNEVAFLLDGYRNLTLKDSNYQYNFFNLMEFRRKRLFSLQGQKVSSENMYRYFVDATKEEPVFFYANDIVYIPYGLAKRATRDLPRYVVMAQVGFPLAKIIGHAFDSVGMQYRVQLNETANISFMTFADQTRDMIVLSNPIKFGDQEFSFTLNNALSESERIAENTALRLLTDSFDSFKTDSLLPWLSNKYEKEKIFFLTMTQEFCRDVEFTQFMMEAYESHILPPQFRIENILGNSEEFLKQFNCRPGSAMTRFEDRLQFPYLIALSKEDLDYMK